MLIITFLCMNCCKSAGLVDVAYVLFEHHVDILRKRTVVLLGKFFLFPPKYPHQRLCLFFL